MWGAAGGFRDNPTRRKTRLDVNWTDNLPTLADLPAMFEPAAGETPPPRIGYHVTRAGLGTWAAVYLRTPAADPRYLSFRAWKENPTAQAGFLNTAADQLVSLIRAWCAAMPRDWVFTVPPQGASEGGTYAAGVLGREVAGRLGLDFQTCLRRTGGAKKWHHPRESMRQAPYTVAVVPPSVCLIVDDWISSGVTLRLAREALAAAGVPSFSFAWATD